MSPTPSYRQVAEWGEFIAYGASLTKEDLPDDLVATLELSHVKNAKESPELLEGAILTQSILDIARKRNIGSIGGTVVLLSTVQNGKILIQGKDLRIQPNGELVLEFYGQRIPLVSFTNYPINSSAGESLKMQF